jgi:hypothetical protein
MSLSKSCAFLGRKNFGNKTGRVSRTVRLISIFLCIISCVALRAGQALAAADFDLSINDVKVAEWETYDLTAVVGYDVPPKLTVSVINKNTEFSITITNVVIASNNFTFSHNNVSGNTIIPAGDSQSFAVVPKPELPAGIYPTTVTVTQSTGISVTFNVSFTVSEAEYGISLTITGENQFTPAANVKYTSPTPKTVTVTNTGNQPTGDLIVSVSDPSAFRISIDRLKSIEAGDNRTFTVVPRLGLGNGTYDAMVTVSNAANNANKFSKSLDVSFRVGDPDALGGCDVGFGALALLGSFALALALKRR